MGRIQTVAPPHEVGFQQIAAVVVVLKLALIQLHAKVGCLEVQGHHLTAGVPENLRNAVLGTYLQISSLITLKVTAAVVVIGSSPAAYSYSNPRGLLSDKYG
jgi:hypothetical protein